MLLQNSDEATSRSEKEKIPTVTYMFSMPLARETEKERKSLDWLDYHKESKTIKDVLV